MPQISGKSFAIQDLVPELLSEVFVHCLNDDARISTGNSSEAPLLLGQVCRRWRSISIFTPRLWCSIAVGASYLNSWHVDPWKDLMATKLWIARSGTYGLSVHLSYASESYRPDECPPLRQIIQSIASQSSRLKCIRAIAPLKTMELLLEPFRLGNFPRLEEISCRVWGREGSQEWPFALSSSPNLKVLCLNRMPIRIDFGNRIHDLQEIDIKSFGEAYSLGELLQCFSNCSSLITLDLQISESSRSTLPHELPAVLELRHLRSLDLYIATDIYSYLLFDQLFLPALRALYLHMDPASPAKHDWPHLGNMLKRSRSPLDSLTIRGVTMTEENLIACLSHAPTLTTLTFSGINCSDIILTAFTVDDTKRSGSAVLCPSLELISLGYPSHFSPIAMKMMILSRWSGQAQSSTEPGKALNEVICFSLDMESIRSDPAIAECMKDGLQL